MIRRHRARIAAALFACLAGVAALIAISVVQAPQACAHDQLVRSSPEDGSILEAWPAAISLEFSDRLIEIGAAIHVVDQGGSTVAQAPPAIDGTTVTQTVPTGLPEGRYRVLWRVVSSDGHPISGSFGFTVGAGQPASPATVGDTGPSSVPPHDAHPRPDENRPASGTSPSQNPESGGVFRQVLVALVGAVIGLGIYGAITLRLSRRPRTIASISHIPRRRSIKENKENTP